MTSDDTPSVPGHEDSATQPDLSAHDVLSAYEAPAVHDEEATHAALTSDDETAAVPLRRALEAVLLIVDEPVTDLTLAQVVLGTVTEVTEALLALAAEYDEQGRGFELRRAAGGWRLYTRADCAPVVERFLREGQQARLSQAALETLTIIAYRQPVGRARIAAIRGVNVDGVVRTLLSRGLIAEMGTDAETGAILYGTTPLFTERLGLDDLSALPSLAPLMPEASDLSDV